MDAFLARNLWLEFFASARNRAKLLFRPKATSSGSEAEKKRKNKKWKTREGVGFLPTPHWLNLILYFFKRKSSISIFNNFLSSLCKFRKYSRQDLGVRLDLLGKFLWCLATSTFFLSTSRFSCIDKKSSIYSRSFSF